MALGLDNVAARQLATPENMAHVARYGRKIVTVLPRTRTEDREFRDRLRKGGVRWKVVVKVPNHRREGDPPDVFSCPVGEEGSTAEGYRLIWYRSSQKASLDAQARERNLEKAILELDELGLKLEHPGKKPIKRGTIVAKVNAIRKRYDCKGFIEINLRKNEILLPRRLRPGRPRADDPIRMEVRYSWTLTFEKDEEALGAERRADGVFPLVSYGLPKRSRKDILEIYKYQPYLEKRFSQIKTDLSIAPVFLKTPHRAVALIDVYFIAIAVSSLIERDLRKAMADTGIEKLPLYPEGRETATPTAQRVLEAFAPVGWHEFQRAGEVICFPLKLDELQEELLHLLGVPESIFL